MTTEKIEVVAPYGVSERKILNFVQAQQDWVIAARDKVEKQTLNVKKKTITVFKEGISIPFKGEQKKIYFKRSSENNISVVFDPSQSIFNLYLPQSLAAENRDSFIKAALVDWFKQQAVIAVKESIDIYAKKYNLYPRFVKIKTQKSRWGSCGIHNDININWLLILAPSQVLEYVVIHEICHIKERNHSANFWFLVEKYCPQYKQHRLWLKQNGRSLMQGL